MQLKRVMGVALLGLVLAAPAPASADWFFTPYIGTNFGGDSEETSVNFGGSLVYSTTLAASSSFMSEGTWPHLGTSTRRAW